MLAEKINHGVRIQKGEETVINKKTLGGFFSYADQEARKLAAKGASCACIEESVVYGWAIHYFEEDSIIGNLYNLDGSLYKEQKQQVSKPSTKTTTNNNDNS